MKNKKIILAVISIILITVLTTVSFAVNNTRTGMTYEEAVKASKERNNKVKNEVVEKTENTVVNETVEVPGNVETNEATGEPSQNEVEPNAPISGENGDKEVSNEEIKENDGKIENKEEELDDKDNENKELEEEGVVSFKETISEDIVKSGETVEYKGVNVDGNVYIIAEKVILDNFKVDGNLFVIAISLELNNVVIEGSFYSVAETVKLDGQVSSAYIMADNISIKPHANIIKELRILSANFDFEGVVGRDLYVCSENVKITDRASIQGDCIVEASNVDISEDAKINGTKQIQIVENTNNVVVVSQQAVYTQIITNCIIVLVVAIFMLYSSPKFVGVNANLRLRDFVKAFFTGLIELIFVILIFILLTYIGYGFGFGLALLILSIILVYLGKILFVISAGIRLAGKSENVSRVKAFFVILFVLVIVEAISLLQLTGMIGIVATIIINLILGITGFGSFVRVILTPSRRKKKLKNVQNNNVDTTANVKIREVRPDDFVMKGAPIVDSKQDNEKDGVVEVKEKEECSQEFKQEVLVESKEEKQEEVIQEPKEDEENKKD